MFQKILKVSLLSLVVSLLPSSFQSANSTEILWNPGVSNDLSGAGAGLVPGAGIRNTGLLVNKWNPDELIMKIIMSESFEDKSIKELMRLTEEFESKWHLFNQDKFVGL